MRNLIDIVRRSAIVLTAAAALLAPLPASAQWAMVSTTTMASLKITGFTMATVRDTERGYGAGYGSPYYNHGGTTGHGYGNGYGAGYSSPYYGYGGYEDYTNYYDDEWEDDDWF